MGLGRVGGRAGGRRGRAGESSFSNYIIGEGGGRGRGREVKERNAGMYVCLYMYVCLSVYVCLYACSICDL